MEVLKHGNLYKTITCTYCKAELGYTLTDIQRYGEIPEKGFYYYVLCPECGDRILFKQE